MLGVFTETLGIAIVVGIPVLLGVIGTLVAAYFPFRRRAGQGGTSLEADPAASMCEPATVPRCFGVDGPLIFLTFYALLFSILRAYDLEPMWYFMAAIYLTGILLGQMLLCDNQDPRWASVVGGAVGNSVAIVVGFVWIGLQHGMTFRTVLESSACNLVAALGAGNLMMIPVSYLMGCLVAGAFLILDRVRTGRWNPPHEPALKKSQDPWDQPQDEPDTGRAGEEPLTEKTFE